MKLAIIRRRYARFGGAERFIENAARELNRAGVEVSVVSQSWGGPGDGFRHIAVPDAGGSRSRRLAQFQRDVALVVAAGNFNLVQTHERLTTADLFRAGDGVHAAWVARQATERGSIRGTLMRLDPMHQLVIETERKMARETAMLFVANSAMVAQEIADWLGVPETRIRLIENGVDLARFHPAAEGARIAARARFGLDADVPVVAFVGSGFERKGVAQLIDALALPECRDIHALIAGHDRTLEKVRRRVKALGLDRRVRILGGAEEPLAVYHAADLFALPSLYDPMPNAALEALACGLPILVTEDAGIAAPVREAGAGIVVTRAPEHIAEGLCAILAQRGDMAAAVSTLAPRFDLASATAQWLALYRELL